MYILVFARTYSCAVKFRYLYGTLSGPERASYSSYEDHIKTELKLESKSTILDGSQHRFIVPNGRL